ncbi:MAG: glycosyltransferase family 2 protein [Cyanobacteria bacterium J06634_5]
MFAKHPEPLNHTFIIVPVHNRKSTTLKCLAHLENQNDLNAYHVVIVDDGSIDGTAEAILKKYSTVSLLKGTGHLWWTGAIKLGMEYALSKGADYCVWLNDDTLPEPGAIQFLIDYCNQHPKTIAAANILDPHTHTPSYGGVVCQRLKVVPVFSQQKEPTLCDGLSGNLVCIPSNLIHVIGYPNSALYPHYYGDVIYTHNAQLSGYQLVLIHEAIAYCIDDNKPIRWFHTNNSVIEILQDRLSIKSTHYWKAHLAFYKSFLGIKGIALYIFNVWLKMLFLVFLRKFSLIAKQ